MECKCKSRPQYHLETCRLFRPNGDIRPIQEIENKFNDDFLEFIQDVVDIYFKLEENNSDYFITFHKKSDNQRIWEDDVDSYILDKFKEFKSHYVNLYIKG